MTNPNLPFNATPILNDGFVGLVDHMGNDASIVQAARISYNKDSRHQPHSEALKELFGDRSELLKVPGPPTGVYDLYSKEEHKQARDKVNKDLSDKDRSLIRYLMRHYHTTPFEMVEFKFIVRVPMDCWRQWIRHRTASVNEYSTRYTEAIDSCQTTPPDEWRLQSTSNKQGSSGFLPASYLEGGANSLISDGQSLSKEEEEFHKEAKRLYLHRLDAGIAKEQARKDLPLSTYTEAYWKIDLHNLFHFLRLRMDSHAQREIRLYATAIYELIKPIVPIACEAFEDYRLNACTFSAQEMEVLKSVIGSMQTSLELADPFEGKPDSLSDREWTEFLGKLT